MRWSWDLGKFAGITVKIHITFFLLLGWIGVSHWLEYRNIVPALTGVAFFLAIFGCVLLHEYGHALAARKFGIATRDITLLPIGGIARLERMPDKPSQELWVAIAGPAVNVAIAALIGGYLLLTHRFVPMSTLGLAHGILLERLLFANLFLVGFNMIPAFPMDGGRVLRALLANRMNYVRATRIAAIVGQGMAFIFAFIGLFANPMLLLVAFFVWVGAAQEAASVEAKSALEGVLVRDVAIGDFRVVSPRDQLSSIVPLLLNGWQQDFPVVDQGRIVGMLKRKDLIAELGLGTSQTSVNHSMYRDFPTAEGSESLEPVVARMEQSEFDTVPILHDGKVVALLTRQNIAEYLIVHSALCAGAKSIRAKQKVIADEIAA